MADKKQYRIVNVGNGVLNINTDNLHPVLGSTDGQSSGTCLNDFYVSNIHACSPLTIFGEVQSELSSANGSNAFAFGENTTASGNNTTALGTNNEAFSFSESVLGLFGTNYTPNSTETFDASDRVFNIGNGTDSGSRSDALSVLKSGNVSAPSLTTSIINSGSGKTLITKEYLVSNANPLKEGSDVAGPYNIDWDFSTQLITLSGDTTFTEINLPSVGFTKVITLYISGDFALTIPNGWTTNMGGTYDGTVLNQIVVEYVKSGVYWVTINQA